MYVATREGGVDRNIALQYAFCHVAPVATREGGVDRNVKAQQEIAGGLLSPPARVAWIEITRRLPPPFAGGVATREGGVDRNAKLV